MGDSSHFSGGGARQSLASQLASIPKPDIRRKVDEFVSTRVNLITRVRDAMAEAQDLQKEQADKRGRKNGYVFAEGDHVLVSTKNMTDDAVSSLGSSKLLPRFIGPFRVLKRTGCAYTLDLPSWIRIHPTFYVGLLKPYLSQATDPDREITVRAQSRVQGEAPSRLGESGNPADDVRQDQRDPNVDLVNTSRATDRHTSSDVNGTSRRELTSRGRGQPITRPVRVPLPVVDRDGVRHYHVEAIVGARRHNGVDQLRVKWLGYPSSENTWEDRSSLLMDCRDVVHEWERNNPQSSQ